MYVQSHSGKKYIATFIDNCFDAVWTYYLASKDQLLLKFKEFKAFIETHYNAKIKIFRSDQGREYILNKFRKLLTDAGLVHHKIVSDIPIQNGKAKCFNCTIVEATKSMLHAAGLLFSL